MANTDLERNEVETYVVLYSMQIRMSGVKHIFETKKEPQRPRHISRLHCSAVQSLFVRLPMHSKVGSGQLSWLLVSLAQITGKRVEINDSNQDSLE